MKTQKKRSGWIFGIALILFVIGFYISNSYNKIFESRTAYLYDPVSDDVFKLKLVPDVHEYNKWDPFIPFKSLTYSLPTYTEYIGELDSIITEHKESMELLRNDPDAWREMSNQRLDSIRQLSTDGNNTLKFWRIEYFIKSDQVYTGLMPNVLSEILQNGEINENEIRVVDATVAETTIYPNDNFDRGTSIQIIHDALLFKGKAAYLLNSNGLN